MAIFEHATGNLDLDGATPQTVTIGYSPTSVRFVNRSTGAQIYWANAFASTWTLVTTALGASSIDANSLIVPSSSDGSDEIDSVTFAAGVGIAGNKAVYEIIR